VRKPVVQAIQEEAMRDNVGQRISKGDIVTVTVPAGGSFARVLSHADAIAIHEEDIKLRGFLDCAGEPRTMPRYIIVPQAELKQLGALYVNRARVKSECYTSITAKAHGGIAELYDDTSGRTYHVPRRYITSILGHSE
jgi:hypothetical protein